MSDNLEPIRALSRVVEKHIIQSLVEWQWKAPTISVDTSNLDQLKEDLRIGGFERIATMIDSKQDISERRRHEGGASSDEEYLADSHRVYEESEAGARSDPAMKQLADKAHNSSTPSPSPQTRSHKDGLAEGSDNEDAAEGSDKEDAAEGSDNEDAAEGSDKEEAAEGSDKEEAAEGSDNEDAAEGSDNEDAAEGSDKEDAAEGINAFEP